MLDIALCGLAFPTAARIRAWLDEHPSLDLRVTLVAEGTDELLEGLARAPVHGVVLDGGLGLEGLSFAQELLAAGYPAVVIAGVADRPHLRERASDLGLTVCPDCDAARLAPLLRRLLGLSHEEVAPGHLIALHSPRGGAGTSVIALSLAYLLTGRGAKVALVELGGGGSAIPLLGLRPGGGWADGAPDSADQVRRALVSVGDSPLRLFPSGGPAVMDQIDPDQVEHLLSLLPSCGMEYIIVDTPAELTLPGATALATAQAIGLVALPDAVSAYRLVQTGEVLRGLHVPTDRITPLLNRTRDGVPARLLEVCAFLGYRAPLRIADEAKPPLDGSGRFAGFKPGSGAARALESLLQHLTMEVSSP